MRDLAFEIRNSQNNLFELLMGCTLSPHLLMLDELVLAEQEEIGRLCMQIVFVENRSK